jgi:hypothetical protein
MNAATASRLRQKLHALSQERNRLEDGLREIRVLLRGPLIAHHTLSGGRRRSEPAFYLFRREDGRKRLRYVRKADLEKTRQLVEASRRYRDGCRRLRSLGLEILSTYKALEESLEDRLPS